MALCSVFILETQRVQKIEIAISHSSVGIKKGYYPNDKYSMFKHLLCVANVSACSLMGLRVGVGSTWSRQKMSHFLFAFRGGTVQSECCP